MNLETTIKELYESEINVQTHTEPPLGMRVVLLSPELNRFDYRWFRMDELDQAANWLEKTACARYPESSYAIKRRDGLVKQQTIEEEIERLRSIEKRYRWLADKVIASDYGENMSGLIGYEIKHCKGPDKIYGRNIDIAIDANIAVDEGWR